MTTRVLICDDSRFARRQMARAVPKGWDVEMLYAENGQQALDIIRQGQADVTFLDLNMPVMDGYQAMEQIRSEDLPTMVIVVSGDVQPEARKRMQAMGALDFIAKPVDTEKLAGLLTQYGLYSGDMEKRQVEEDTASQSDRLDVYRELINVAMGQAGDKLAQVLGEFIHLPIPNVNQIASSELRMAIAEIQHKAYVSAVSQGFVSAGIKGEALVIFNETNFSSLVKLLKYRSQALNEQQEVEALMDVSNILIGACLNALAEQLDVKFSQNHPIILGRHCDLEQLLKNNVSRWNQVVAIEIGYSIDSQDIHFDLLLLFPKESMDVMFDKLMYMSGRADGYPA
ncbi:response regulator [Bowmanella dokdonensis]|uniref:Response regulator n=1 Tax=Bowmanella dokdonensis TaxID=751969 RepID=A0A939DPI0_9ALTE|nr:response regulator [Bowmanella dokdonensis]MBN7826578.1 response regulator [Bowmanella dokdonensis]